MNDFQKYLEIQMKNDEFRAEYERTRPDFAAKQAQINARFKKPKKNPDKSNRNI